MVRSVRCGSSLRTSAPSPMAALRASTTSTAGTTPGVRLMASGAGSVLLTVPMLSLAELYPDMGWRRVPESGEYCDQGCSRLAAGLAKLVQSQRLPTSDRVWRGMTELIAHQSDTHQKALRINLDPRWYGTIAEIGAGQEVVRWFFRVGGAAGTVAKSMSAYDMAVSDAVYGKADRYVSVGRLQGMLDHEFGLNVERLNEERGDSNCFFAFADTVVARSYRGGNECHGWMVSIRKSREWACRWPAWQFRGVAPVLVRGGVIRAAGVAAPRCGGLRGWRSRA